MKKKNKELISILFFIGLLLCASNCFSFNIFENAHIIKARAFITAGMEDKAVILLEEEINGSDKHEANPTNAEAHFLLGKLYASRGKIEDSEKRFSSAIKINPEYGPLIGKELLKIANEKMKAGDPVLAGALYRGAMHYDEKLRKQTAPKLFKLGVLFAKEGNAAKAEKNFESAAKADPGLESKIPLEYKNAADAHLENNDQKAALPLYEKAIARNARLAGDIAKKLFEYGKEKNSEYLVGIAAKIDPGLRMKAKELCWSRIEKLSGQELLNLNWSEKQCGELNESKKEVIGKKLLREGNQQNSENEKEKYYSEASKYVSKEIMFDATVEYYSKKLGVPQTAELNDINDWKLIGHVKGGYRIEYLSLESFIKKSNGGEKRWDSAISETYYYTFYSGTDSDVWFKKDENNTVVYYWIIEKN